MAQRVDPSYYKYVEKKLSNGVLLSGIMLLKPEKWEGLVFTYEGGKFGEVQEGNKIPVQYDFKILDNPQKISEREMNEDEFVKLLGDIFVDIVEQVYMEKNNEKSKEN